MGLMEKVVVDLGSILSLKENAVYGTQLTESRIPGSIQFNRENTKEF